MRPKHLQNDSKMEPKWSPEANFSYFCETLILDDPPMVLADFNVPGGQEIEKKAIQNATLEQSCKKVALFRQKVRKL